MKKNDVLIAIFSFNMGPALENCLGYLDKFAGGFDKVLIDDNSTDECTLSVIEKWRPHLKEVFSIKDDKEGRRHGNLYANIQKMIDYATDHGFKYLLAVQDDTQLVRMLDDSILQEYAQIFQSDTTVIQITPVFLKGDLKYRIVPEVGGYSNLQQVAYADIGVLDLTRFRESGWRLVEGERVNQAALIERGYKRVYPFRPVVTQIPFPNRFRNGKLKRSLLVWRRGTYGYHAMTAQEIEQMDRRPLEDFPFYRRFLRVRNMVLARFAYIITRDSKLPT